MRGRGRGGASRAAINAFHLAVDNPKVRRSASASSARANALSRTNSLTDRFEAAAAACNAAFAAGVNRRSSFSLRNGRDGISPPSLFKNIRAARQRQDNKVWGVTLAAVTLYNLTVPKLVMAVLQKRFIRALPAFARPQLIN